MRPVVLHAMHQREDNAEPGAEGEDGADAEARVRGRGYGGRGDLRVVRLGLKAEPVARDGQEEVQPGEEIEDQRKVEFRAAPAVVLRERKRVDVV